MLPGKLKLHSMRLLLPKCLWALTVAFLLFSAPLHAQNAIHFDGNNDYVQTTYGGVQGTNARTVEAWIKTTFVSTQQVIADWGDMTLGHRFTFNMIAGKLRCEIGGQGVTGPTVISDNQWHHVAVTFDNNSNPKYNLYVDGALEASFNLTSVTINTSSVTDFRIGMRIDGVNNFTGSIDEVRVWDYARSAAEIDQNKDAEFCSIPSGLVAYYKLNEGVAAGSNTGLNIAPDVSGAGNNGTLINFALSGATSNWVTGVTLPAGVTTSTVSEIGCDSYTSPSGNYTWNQSGIYLDTIPTTAGCDSAMTINLTIQNSSTGTLTAAACSSFVSPGSNQTWTTSGTYTDTLTNAAGCDSILTVQLSINNSAASITETACVSYTAPSGNATWTTSGTYADTIQNAAGCDSILTIQLTILEGSTSIINENVCSSYTSPSGNFTWTTSGLYSDTLTNAIGCDSVISINLAVANVDTAVSTSGNTLTASATTAAYQWLDCSDGLTPIAGADNQSFTATQSGSYAVEVTQGACVDTSRCVGVVYVGIDAPKSIWEITVYPNPTTGLLSIDMTDIFPEIQVEVLDMTGKKVQSNNFYGVSKFQLNLEQPAGLYMVHIYTGNQHHVWRVMQTE